MEKLTKEMMLERLKEADFKTAAARQLMTQLIEFHEDFTRRNRQQHFRGIALTIGMCFPEDNRAIQNLLLRPKPTQEGNKLPASRLMRGPQTSQVGEHKVRIFNMGKIRVFEGDIPDKDALREKYPTMAQLRQWAKDNDFTLAPNLQDIEKALDRIVKQAEARAKGRSV